MVYKRQGVVAITSLELPGTETEEDHGQVSEGIDGDAVGRAPGPGPTHCNRGATDQQGGRGTCAFFDLAVNDTDAENGTVRVFLFPGSVPHSQQSFGAYPYPQNTGLINFPNSPRPSYQGTGYYPGSGLYPYSSDCTYWCVQNVGFSREVYCCRQ
ncbi:uncharacterized protein LOC119587163 [Penaeus monodon]|uniref:uncharacterized protein LOC119587163 n=1 Tax=Penaeus monodon TaxID=6687 RepID=UPI0018A6D42B|nr:uncharacterized protein LOC119587163 [Penaeus monodon]